MGLLKDLCYNFAQGFMDGVNPKRVEDRRKKYLVDISNSIKNFASNLESWEGEELDKEGFEKVGKIILRYAKLYKKATPLNSIEMSEIYRNFNRLENALNKLN